MFSHIVDAAWKYYQEEQTAVDETASLRAQLHDVDRGISNLVRAMEAGAVSDTLVMRLQSLEDQKAALNKSIAQAELAMGPILTRERIEFFLLRFRDADPNREEDRNAIVNTFLNAIYLFDDKITITFNYRPDGVNKKQVTLTELDAGGGSTLDPSTPVHASRSNIFSIRLFRHVIVVTIKIEHQ